MFFSNNLNIVSSPMKLVQKNVIMWQFTILSGLPRFYGKINGYVVLYRRKDKNITR